VSSSSGIANPLWLVCFSVVMLIVVTFIALSRANSNSLVALKSKKPPVTRAAFWRSVDEGD
jgi:hypothetical protein